MLIQKIIKGQMDTNDIKVIYASNHDEAILNLLKDRYQNKCFKSCYILDLKIIRRSPLISNFDRAGGYYHFDYEMLVDGIVYDQYEVITDCKILAITSDGTTSMGSKYAAIGINSQNTLQTYTVGKIVPVRVLHCKYELTINKISVTAIPFIPIISPTSGVRYSISLESSDKEEISLLLNKLNSELELLDLEDHKLVNRFKEIYYPYTKEHKMKSKDILIDINDIKVDTVYTVSYSDWLDLLKPQCLLHPHVIDSKSTRAKKLNKDKDKDKDTKTGDSKEDNVDIVQHGKNILLGYINHIIKNVMCIRSLASTYKIDESTKSIWSYYIKNKLTEEQINKVKK